jgi:predicted transcriptional regulator
VEKRIGLLKGIARGEKAVEEGRVVSHAKATRWLKQPGRNQLPR